LFQEGKAVDEKNLHFYYLFIQHINIYLQIRLLNCFLSVLLRCFNFIPEINLHIRHLEPWAQFC